MVISKMPLSVFNRALELYGEEPETSLPAAMSALQSAESRKDLMAEWPGITAIGQAMAEYMSGAGPWWHEGECGYQILP